jgi:hypothetical protein
VPLNEQYVCQLLQQDCPCRAQLLLLLVGILLFTCNNMSCRWLHLRHVPLHTCDSTEMLQAIDASPYLIYMLNLLLWLQLENLAAIVEPMSDLARSTLKLYCVVPSWWLTNLRSRSLSCSSCNASQFDSCCNVIPVPCICLPGNPWLVLLQLSWFLEGCSSHSLCASASKPTTINGFGLKHAWKS